MRLLLDEGFPSPPGFDAARIDASVEVTTLRDFDHGLVGVQTPDWYLYLRASEAGFDALVTRDWHQTEQPEELWALTRTSLSIVTWRRSIEDPVREWGQLFAYMPEVRRMLTEHGPSVVFLPSPRLGKSNVRKASAELGRLASDLRISNSQLRSQAQLTIREELEGRHELDRFVDVFD